MCGIVGAAGNLDKNVNKMFRDMLVFDQVRGFDSTGVAVVGSAENATVQVEKDTGTPNDLWTWGTSNLFDNRGVAKSLFKVMIGHNRAATVGAISRENAHPYQFTHITGVHNGSLSYYDDLDGAKTHEVDSQALINTIATRGIDKTWKSFYGAASVVYWDDNEKTLNIIRNEQRPLYVIWSKKGDAIFWASEEWMIYTAAGRNNVDLNKNETGRYVIASPKPHTLYKYKVTATTISLLEERELEKKSYAQTKHNPYTPHNYTHGGVGNQIYSKIWKDQAWKIKTGWAENLERAEKETVGLKFRAVTLVETSSQNTRGFYVYGITKAGERVEVYPSNPLQYEKWKTIFDANKENEIWCEFIHRPRVQVTNVTVNTDVKAYKISDEGVAISSFKEKEKTHLLKKEQTNVVPLVKLYKSLTGSVSEAEWYRIMNNLPTKGCCTACDNPISIEQHRDIMWINKNCVLCEECKKDPTIQEYVQTWYVG
jgi:predicted glutamine amidotransferase